MLTIYPHQMFQADFLKMMEVFNRQEELDSSYQDETKNGKELFYFFGEEILPNILSNDWVFEASRIFAEEYANEYFIMIRLLGAVSETQDKLTILRNEVLDLLRASYKLGICSTPVNLVKTSEFTKLVNLDDLPEHLRLKADKILDDALDLEPLYVNITSKAIQAMYEKGFPRIFFVVRRAMKFNLGLKPTKSDDRLMSAHEYINWCEHNLDENHIIYQLFVKHKLFYRMTRNVDSHVDGPKWISKSNEVYLPDKENQQSFHINDFSQKYRYLMYFCETGVRGILATFCDRERGPISNVVRDKYIKIYEQKDEFIDALRDYPVR